MIAGVSWRVAHRPVPAPVPTSIAQLGRQPAQKKESGVKSSAATSYVAFVLTAGAERAAATQPRLAIPAAAEQVRLEVKLEVTGFRDYDAVLRTVEGKEVWRTSGLAEEKAMLNVTVPANLFQTTDYLLTVSGSKPDGKREVAGEYSLSVHKRP